MKITLEPYSGGSFTSEKDAEHISVVVEMFKGLLVASGYHPSTVDNYVPNIEDGDWFPEIPENSEPEHEVTLPQEWVDVAKAIDK